MKRAALLLCVLSACDLRAPIGDGPPDASTAGGSGGGGAAVGGGSAGGGSAGGGSAGGGSSTDGGTCAAQCDCPGGTVCSIDHQCVGYACSDQCNGTTPCPCGRACVNGVCDFPSGSLRSCAYNCDCPRNELCINSRCIKQTCGHGGGDCRGDSECSDCGKVCEPYAHYCTPKGIGCNCTGSCATWGLDGQICDLSTTPSRCAAPPGTLIDLGGGNFVSNGPFGGNTFTASGSVVLSGTVTTLTLVADMSVPTHDSVTAKIFAPDGTSSSDTLQWTCTGGGPSRWTGKRTLATPTGGGGAWRVELTEYPVMSGPLPNVGHAWFYVE